MSERQADSLASFVSESAEPEREMISAYDRYYATGYYASRYPAANSRSLSLALANGAASAARILDFGCGNGRYVLALLEKTRSDLVGYDVSHVALETLSGHLAGNPHRGRVSLVEGPQSQLDGQAPFDVVLSMFGVLSHIRGRDARLSTLMRLRRLLTPRSGRLVISVPSVLRRRVVENLSCSLRRRLFGRAPGVQEVGDIVYSRHFNGGDTNFYYHLYTAARLHADLAEAGFRGIELYPESVLPEAAVTRSQAMRNLDRVLLPYCPVNFGYGIVAVARPG